MTPASRTLQLAELLAQHRGQPLGDTVRTATSRTLFNIIAVAIGAVRTPGVRRLADLGSIGQVPCTPSVLANAGTTPEHAALVTGFAGHYDDYDDTHLATVIHPAAATLGAVWALGRGRHVSGQDLLTAFALGCESQLRLGVAVSPEHYDRGWHITGTCGVLGATVAAGLVGGLTAPQLERAISMACVRTLGHREAFGTELKPLHAGLAAANAVRIVNEVLRTRDGHADVDAVSMLVTALAPETGDDATVWEAFGQHWELASNALKPYPCGIVAHPGIDAAIAVSDALSDRALDSSDIERIEFRCHPLVPELMGRPDPVDDLEARFSATHGVACGVLFGTVGLAQFDTVAATDPAVIQLRSRITLLPDGSMPRDSAHLTVFLRSGAPLVVSVKHARGSASRQLTDDEVLAKADAQLSLGGGPAARGLWDWVGELDEVGDDPWSALPVFEDEVAIR